MMVLVVVMEVVWWRLGSTSGVGVVVIYYHHLALHLAPMASPCTAANSSLCPGHPKGCCRGRVSGCRLTTTLPPPFTPRHWPLEHTEATHKSLGVNHVVRSWSATTTQPDLKFMVPGFQHIIKEMLLYITMVILYPIQNVGLKNNSTQYILSHWERITRFLWVYTFVSNTGNINLEHTETWTIFCFLCCLSSSPHRLDTITLQNLIILSLPIKRLLWDIISGHPRWRQDEGK